VPELLPPDSPDVRGRRLAAGLTQEQLARSAEISLAYMARLDRGLIPQRGGEAFERVLDVLDGYAEGPGP
jgi:predicted transcriptional regulator